MSAPHRRTYLDRDTITFMGCQCHLYPIVDIEPFYDAKSREGVFHEVVKNMVFKILQPSSTRRNTYLDDDQVFLLKEQCVT